ncbi:hypothetical protein Q2T42_02395 [Leptolyngbya boryana CZ1]|uniref:Uncharacterized protein n=1 Tax=Leptolyngbya boryana CZ1 TaxID=3060204 RepID=A0AA97AQN2_LEPBY|nr:MULTISPECIES: hypothetical protein [Leptolyngbya]WNZ46687.1 hypothetical protein Q2T42_02395 [Leptolyngbya boryana CZ1]
MPQRFAYISTILARFWQDIAEKSGLGLEDSQCQRSHLDQVLIK